MRPTSTYLTLCSDVRVYISDIRGIYTQVTVFDFDRIDKHTHAKRFSPYHSIVRVKKVMLILVKVGQGKCCSNCKK